MTEIDDTPLFLPVLLGTVRQGRESERVANWLVDRMCGHPEIETRLFDPRTMNLPMDDEGQELKFLNPEYRNAIVRADGLVIVSPEYNHGYPGSLKRALDVLLTEYVHRAVGLVGVSSGGFGGVRAIEKLVSVVRELGLMVTFTDLNVSRVGEVFAADGTVSDASLARRAEAFLAELLWVARALRCARRTLPSPYDQRARELQAEWERRMGPER